MPDCSSITADSARRESRCIGRQRIRRQCCAQLQLAAAARCQRSVRPARQLERRHAGTIRREGISRPLAGRREIELAIGRATRVRRRRLQSRCDATAHRHARRRQWAPADAAAPDRPPADSAGGARRSAPRVETLTVSPARSQPDEKAQRLTVVVPATMVLLPVFRRTASMLGTELLQYRAASAGRAR